MKNLKIEEKLKILKISSYQREVLRCVISLQVLAGIWIQKAQRHQLLQEVMDQVEKEV